MAIIQKRADELRVGDVLPEKPGFYPRVVVHHVHVAGGSVCPHTFPAGPHSSRPPYAPILYNGSDLVDVEAPDLTPAQMHAEELFALVRQAETWLSDVPEMDGVGVWLTGARNLRATIAPDPPTLAEALAAMAGMQGILDTHRPVEHMAEKASRFHDVLRRARRAGML